MVSACGRTRTQRGRSSRQGRRSQQGRRLRSRGRRYLAKRKHQHQAKRQAVQKRKRTLKRSCRSIRAKTLIQLKEGSRFLSQGAKRCMIRFVKDMYKKLSRRAKQLPRESHNRLITVFYMEATLRHAAPMRWRRRAAAVAVKSRR